jgi:alkylated DNA nucleotide flippase Atl1
MAGESLVIEEELPQFASDVLDDIDQVPAGRVTTYGDIAARVGGGGPRRVARVLSRYGALVPWWRVVNASGCLPDSLSSEALAHWREEGTPLKAVSGESGVGPGWPPRVDLRLARW